MTIKIHCSHLSITLESVKEYKQFCKSLGDNCAVKLQKFNPSIVHNYYGRELKIGNIKIIKKEV